MFLLSLAVVNWGLQYKMSLYHSDKAGQAPAKLWTGKTAGAAIASAKIEQQPLTFLFFALALLVFLRYLSIRLAGSSVRRFTVAWKLRLLTSLYAFFFRPPPSSLSVLFSCAAQTA
jgi:hypothetical protein